MEVILQELAPTGTINDKTKHEYCIKALEDILQSDQIDYTTYFSSRAESGSIVEDIAELDAHIATLEKQIRSLLVDNKADMIDTILNKSKETVVLERISHELEHLWEFDTKTDSKHDNNEAGESRDSLLDDFLSEHNGPSKSQDKQKKSDDDEFHKALNNLRKRVMDKNDKNNSTTSANLTTLFENLSGITDLMELPSLAHTCIKTGHYQEAIMLYVHTNSLKSKFQDFSIIQDIYSSVLNEVCTTMLTGLVKLLSTNLTMNSLKKILQYLSAIPPFSENDKTSLLTVYLSMRLKFIQNQIALYSLDSENSDAMVEISVKRQIEVVREHIYMSLNVYAKTFDVSKNPIRIPLAIGESTNENIEDSLQETLEDRNESEQNKTENHIKECPDLSIDNVKEQEDEKQKEKNENITPDSEEDKRPNDQALREEKAEITGEKHIDTNPLMLNFVNDCITYLLTELTHVYKQDSNAVNNSTCLQLVYCSFRLNDLNSNYQHLLLNKIAETKLFTTAQLTAAIERRTELASKYTFT